MNTGNLPEKIRAFVAIYPSAEVIRHLESIQKQLRTIVAPDAIRWTKPEQIHLTLRFLGDIERSSIAKFESVLKEIAIELCAFPLRAESIGCFPNDKRPKIIWAGLAGELEWLRALKEKLDPAFAEMGYAPEEKEFHAHLTLGRVANLKFVDARRFVQELSSFQSKQFGEWQVREIFLMQSILSSEGATHNVLNLFPLKKV